MDEFGGDHQALIECSIFEYFLHECIQLRLAHLYPIDPFFKAEERVAALKKAADYAQIVMKMYDTFLACFDENLLPFDATLKRRLDWFKFIGLVYFWDDGRLEAFDGTGRAMLSMQRGLCSAYDIFNSLFVDSIVPFSSHQMLLELQTQVYIASLQNTTSPFVDVFKQKYDQIQNGQEWLKRSNQQREEIESDLDGLTEKHPYALFIKELQSYLASLYVSFELPLMLRFVKNTLGSIVVDEQHNAQDNVKKVSFNMTTFLKDDTQFTVDGGGTGDLETQIHDYGLANSDDSDDKETDTISIDLESGILEPVPEELAQNLLLDIDDEAQQTLKTPTLKPTILTGDEKYSELRRLADEIEGMDCSTAPKVLRARLNDKDTLLTRVVDEKHVDGEKYSKNHEEKNLFDRHESAEQINWSDNENDEFVENRDSDDDDIGNTKSMSDDKSCALAQKVSWSAAESKRLKLGFKKYGKQWAKIKSEYNFKNRTGTQLKDRARTMNLI